MGQTSRPFPGQTIHSTRLKPPSKRGNLRKLLETFPSLRKGWLRKNWHRVWRRNFTSLRDSRNQPLQ